MLDAAKWDLTEGNGGTALVQGALVAHGKYALKVHGLASAKDDYALIVTKSGPETLKGAHFGRANFYITPKPLTSGHTQMVFAGVDGTGAANGPGPFNKLRYLEVSNINGGWQFGFDLLDIAPLVEEVYYPARSQSSYDEVDVPRMAIHRSARYGQRLGRRHVPRHVRRRSCLLPGRARAGSTAIQRDQQRSDWRLQALRFRLPRLAPEPTLRPLLRRHRPRHEARRLRTMTLQRVKCPAFQGFSSAAYSGSPRRSYSPSTRCAAK
jgi:hypothetical protein